MGTTINRKKQCYHRKYQIFDFITLEKSQIEHCDMKMEVEMETEVKDAVLDSLRAISAIARVMMMHFGDTNKNTENQSYVTCLNIICEEIEKIRKMVCQ